MSAPTKKTPAKRAASKAAKPAPEPVLSEEDLAALTAGQQEQELEPGQIRPVVIGKRGRRGDVPVEMVTIFELDDVPYQIPKNPSAALVLSWILEVQKKGVALGNQAVAVQILGDEPLEKLKASPEVEAEDLFGIISNIGAVFFASENFQKITAAPDPS